MPFPPCTCSVYLQLGYLIYLSYSFNINIVRVLSTSDKNGKPKIQNFYILVWVCKRQILATLTKKLCLMCVLALPVCIFIYYYKQVIAVLTLKKFVFFTSGLNSYFAVIRFWVSTNGCVKWWVVGKKRNICAFMLFLFEKTWNLFFIWTIAGGCLIHSISCKRH